MSRFPKHSRNRCGRCGYSWYPRGHAVSGACPSCGSDDVQIPAPSGLIGCLVLLVVPFAIISIGSLALSVLLALGTAPVTTTVVGVLAIGSTIAVVVTRKRSRARKVFAMQQHLLALQQAHATQAERVRQTQIAEEEWRRRQRYEQLAAYFGPQVADAIVARTLWVGATEPMVVAMFGPPDDVEDLVLKTKTKRVLKYRDVMHAGRYSLKVTLENGVVVGWDDKR